LELQTLSPRHASESSAFEPHVIEAPSFGTSGLKAASKAPPSFILKYFGWLNSEYFPEGVDAIRARPKVFEFDRLIPFIFLHVGCLAAFWVGWSPFAVGLMVALYFVRMFAVTGFYHRYFSHKTYKTSRFMQFVFALWGLTCVQRGPLWWSAHHRLHHQMSDQPKDLHSPLQRGFLWSHIGWMATTPNMTTDYNMVKDWAKFPELVFLNRFDWMGALFLLVSMIILGNTLEATAPQLGTNALQLVVWGFFISTVALHHGTWTINSLAHQFGSRRFNTTDTSRNNFWLALLTMGEGWHNNHHRYQGSIRQGFYWWEVDVTFYILTVFSWFGLIWDLRMVPEQAYLEAKTVPVGNIPTRASVAAAAQPVFN
jgi:stearoyl-CoA desaturase (Delta-9 desaturase)